LPQPTRRSENRFLSSHWLIYPALALAILVAYYPVIHYDFVNYDDPDYTTANPHIRGGLTVANAEWAFTSSYKANWIPLSWMSHMLDRQFFGWNPGADHAVNLALHILSTLLVFALFKRMTKTIWPSALVAFAFGLHPLHVESVAWIAERKDVLCAFFFFLTIWLYLDYIAKPNVWRYIMMATAFAFALMSKGMAVTLPFLLLVLDGWPLDRLKGGNLRRVFVEKIPLIALALAASAITFVAQRGGGAIEEGVASSFLIENAVISYAVYLRQFIGPANLAAFYPFDPGNAGWQVMVAAAALAAISAFAILRRTQQPYLLAGWLWFLGTLVPVIGVVQIGPQAHADRYMYIPLIGLAMMLFFGAADFVQRANWRVPQFVLAAVLCIAWTGAARANVSNWRDTQSLFAHAVEVTSNNSVAYSNLGAAEHQAGHLEEAIAHYRRALEISPHFANAENGFGETLVAQGRTEEAVSHFTEAVRLAPDFVPSHINLGAAYIRMRMAIQAAEQYRAALALDQESAEAHCGFGIALNLLGQRQEGLPQLFEAVRINPDYVDGHYNLGYVLALDGRVDEAATEFRTAIRLDPNDVEAHESLGIAFGKQGNMQDAAAEFKKAVDIRPDYVKARFNYASALAAMENYQDAIAQFNAILDLAPNFEPAQESLNRCIALQKSLPDPAEAGPRKH
jgi:tetratricopeptide (TPR) repeat protein